MTKEIIFTPEVTPPQGPYAQAIKITNPKAVIYTGTITALDENWNVVGAGDIRTQTRKTIENLKKIVKESGAEMTDIVKTTWYLTDIRHMPEVAEVRNEMFEGAVPASGTIPINHLYYPDLLLEMEAVIVISE